MKEILIVDYQKNKLDWFGLKNTVFIYKLMIINLTKLITECIFGVISS